MSHGRPWSNPSPLRIACSGDREKLGACWKVSIQGDVKVFPDGRVPPGAISEDCERVHRSSALQESVDTWPMAIAIT